MATKITRLLEWCKDNNLWIHPDVEIFKLDHTPCQNQLGCRALRPIELYTIIVKIPKSCILSVKSSAFSLALLQDPKQSLENDGNLMLSLAVLLELKLGVKSKWWGYLQSLPSMVAIASLWSEVNGEDGREAYQWLLGTDAARVIETENIAIGLYSFYEKYAHPLLVDVGVEASFLDIAHAYSLVSSRAFHVDTYHGISMVPVADIFNHVDDHHVHLQSDYFVCPTCGSLEECLHDREGIESSAVKSRPISLDDACEMVTNSQVLESEEIYNTYDSQLPDSHLLCHYGFILGGNAHNLVSWESLEKVDRSIIDAFQLGGTSSFLHHSIFYYLLRTKACPLCDLLFDSHSSIPGGIANRGQVTTRDRSAQNPVTKISTLSSANATSSEGTTVDSSSLKRRAFCINADGALSFELFVLIFAYCFTRVAIDPPLDPLAEDKSWFDGINEKDLEVKWGLMVKVLEGQESLSQHCEPEEFDHIGSLVSEISSCIESLCKARLDKMYHPGNAVLSMGGLGEALDVSLPTRPLTRLAIEYVIIERSIMESCMASWMELVCRLYGDVGGISGLESTEEGLTATS